MAGSSDPTDCIIIGGGPAGLTAALYLGRFLRRVIVFDACDGRAQMIPKTHNLAGFPEGVSGSELLELMRSHARRFGAAVETSRLRQVTQVGDMFCVATDQHTITARTVILATGVFNHRPPLSAADHDRGVALGLIRYCPVCDAYEVRGKRIAVLGQGEHGAREASFVRHYSASVTLIPTEGSSGKAERGIATLAAPIKCVSLANGQVVITLQTEDCHSFDTLYVALGSTPRTEIAVGLGVRLGTEGHVAVDAQQQTSIKGVYAIGDVTDGLDQIAVAMGHGANAATAIHHSLDDVKT